MSTEAENPAFWDVVIVETATRKVTAIAGANLSGESLERRQNTVAERLDAHHAVHQVPTGRYKLNDVLDEDSTKP